MEDHRKYYAKVLLFGEYAVIYGSMGLSMPFRAYTSEFRFIAGEQNQEEVTSNHSLRTFHEYLKQLKEKGELIADFDLDRFAVDISAGLYFDSIIPQGFGLGSSGAVCAGVYDRYAANKIVLNESNWDDEVLTLKDIFVQMESHFHGISSGLDPLNSYLNCPIHILGKERILPVKPDVPDDVKIFFLDTGTTGKTGPLVNLFFDKLRSYNYYKKFNHGFMPANNSCIEALLHGDISGFYESISELSSLTMELFDEMIPGAFKELWSKGLETGDYFLKLCGSGGGGFLLGFTKDLDKADKAFEASGRKIIPWQEDS